MRTRWLTAALLVALPFVSGIALAEDAPQVASEVKQVAATSESPSANTSQTAQVAKPFHRKPIFLGMLRRSNAIRGQVGLHPHKINPVLSAAAQDHANYMAQTGQFSHYVNGGPQYRANKYGFRGGVWENICYGASTVDGAFNMWQNSSGHYAAITSGTTEAGFGYAVASTGLIYWVGVYSTPTQGDVTGETEAVMAEALAAEEAQRKEEEKNVAQEQPRDTNVVPAAAEVPVSQDPAAVATSNPAAENPAGNVNTTNAQPQNYYYYYPQNNTRRRLFRRG